MASLVFGLVFCVGTVNAQVVRDISTFQSCPSCRITLGDSLLLGGQPGSPGEIVTSGGGGLIVLLSPEEGHFVVLPRGGQELKVFAADGRFLRQIGRRGEGPGEFVAIVRADIEGSMLRVLDLGRSRMMEFTLDGAHVREYRYPFDGDFVAHGPARVMAASWERHPDRVGYPLHSFDLNSGVTASFGTLVERFVPGPYDGLQLRRIGVPSRGGPERVMVGRAEELRFELVNAETRDVELVLHGDPGWFPRATRVFDGSAPPPSLTLDYVVDRNERLWLLTMVANPRWEQGIAADPSRPGRVLIPSASGVWDARLDVFDLRSGLHTAGPVWDDVHARAFALSPSGDPLLYRHIVDLNNLTERVSVRPLVFVGP